MPKGVELLKTLFLGGMTQGDTIAILDMERYFVSNIYDMSAYYFTLFYCIRGNIVMEAMIRLRMSEHDAHYGGGLVDGAKMLQLFGDVATELLIQLDGDEGLFAGYEDIAFTAPVYAGDYIQVTGKITKVGNSSRKMSFEAYKVIIPRRDINESACDVLEEPELVCKAVGTCVVPKMKQRKPH